MFVLFLLASVSVCAQGRKRRRARNGMRFGASSREQIHPSVFGKLMDEKFDEQLEETVNKGIRKDRKNVRDGMSPQGVMFGRDLEELVNEKIARKKRRYDALLRAARSVLDVTGVKYQVSGSQFEKNLANLLQELLNPNITT